MIPYIVQLHSVALAMEPTCKGVALIIPYIWWHWHMKELGRKATVPFPMLAIKVKQ